MTAMSKERLIKAAAELKAAAPEKAYAALEEVGKAEAGGK